MTVPPPSDLAIALRDGPRSALAVRSGAEAAALAEVLYLRLLVIALAGIQFVCGLAVVSAIVRTQHSDFIRTTVLSLFIALLAALALRARVVCYRAMRRWPQASLVAPCISVAALIVDGVSHSPLSYVCAVSIAFPAFVCGRRWALAAAALISVGAIAAAALRTGLEALNSTGQGTSGYFVWALVCSGLAESFVQITMRCPHVDSVPSVALPPIRVPNLVGDQRPPVSTDPVEQPRPPVNHDVALRSARSPLTARQLQVVALLADGLRADDIAQRLGVSTSTVYRYVERAKQRAGVRSRSDLVALAIREGLVPTHAEGNSSPAGGGLWRGAETEAHTPAAGQGQTAGRAAVIEGEGPRR